MQFSIISGNTVSSDLLHIKNLTFGDVKSNYSPVLK